MALLKEIETESGIVVNYHNASIVKDTVNKSITMYVNSYMSKEARESGKKPAVTGKQYMISHATEIPTGEEVDGEPVFVSFFDTLPADAGVEDIAYAYLKTLPEFAGAEDV